MKSAYQSAGEDLLILCGNSNFADIFGNFGYFQKWSNGHKYQDSWYLSKAN